MPATQANSIPRKRSNNLRLSMIIFSLFIQVLGAFVSLRISLTRSRPKCHWNKASILNDLRATGCSVVFVYVVKVLLF